MGQQSSSSEARRTRRTENDAKRLEAAYKTFAEGFDVPVDDILKREGNAVLMWDATPTDAQASSVEGCLKR